MRCFSHVATGSLLAETMGRGVEDDEQRDGAPPLEPSSARLQGEGQEHHLREEESKSGKGESAQCCTSSQSEPEDKGVPG